MRIKTFLLACALSFFFFAPLCARAQGTDTETLSFEIEIEPVFQVETDSAEGGRIGLNLSTEKDSVQTASVSVWSNQGLPYKIIQQLEAAPLNDQGAEFPLGQIRFSASDGAQGGRSEVRASTPLSLLPTTLFSSNPRGDSDRFTLLYEVSGDRLMPAGTYRARLLIEERLG